MPKTYLLSAAIVALVITAGTRAEAAPASRDTVSVQVFQGASGARTLLYQSTATMVADDTAHSMGGAASAHGGRLALTVIPSVRQVRARVALSFDARHGQAVHSTINTAVGKTATASFRHAGKTYEVVLHARKA